MSGVKLESWRHYPSILCGTQVAYINGSIDDTIRVLVFSFTVQAIGYLVVKMI